MALGIPLPSADFGGNIARNSQNLFNQLLQKNLTEAEREQAERHFQEQLKLSKAAAGRNAQAASDAHKLAMMKLDPDAEINQLKRMIAAFGGGSKPKQETAQESYIPSIGGAFEPLESQYPALEGMFKRGNVNLNNRPQVPNSEEGGVSTIYSMGIGLDNGREALIPRVSDDGRILSEPEAIDQFKKTGKHLGIYNSKQEADKAAQQLHQQQAAQYGQNEQIPAINEQAISPREAQESTKNNGIDMDLIKNSPILRGWFKKHFGVDPVELSQAEKDKAAFELFKNKEDYRIEHPRPSSSGISAGDRAADRALKRDQLNERIQHNRILEKNASKEEKVDLQRQRDELEIAKKKLIEEDKAALEYDKARNKEQGKQYADLEKQGIEGIKSAPLYNELKELASDPILESMRQHPYLGHLEFGYYKRSGTPEQKNYLAKFDIVTNKLIADTAKGLNTRFTDKDLQLAKDMKINDNDSLDAIKSKSHLLLYLHEIGQERLDKAIEISAQEHLSPYQAFKKADKVINGDKIREQIKKQIFGSSSDLPSGITEDDITVTHAETGLSREQIIAQYKHKHGG